MKKKLPVVNVLIRGILVISVFLMLTSCSTYRHYYLVDKETEVYEDSPGTSDRYQDIPPGDTISVDTPWNEPSAPDHIIGEIMHHNSVMKPNLTIHNMLIFRHLYSRKLSNKIVKRERLTLVKPKSFTYSDEDSKSMPVESSTATKNSSSNNHVIETGPRGGRYYINKNGNKTYIKKK